MTRAYNFSAGPATLPEEVLLEAQSEMLDFRGTGMSLMEMSHRGKEYTEVHEEAISNIKELLGLSEDYSVLFLQGGASGQFYTLPMNILTPESTADYVYSGAWAKKAIAEAKRFGKVNIAADVTNCTPLRMPTQDELKLSADARYLHITSNETIEGTQFKTFPKANVPLVGDMSSDILSRPFDPSPFGMIYAGAQKNLGPAGVTLVIVRNDFVAEANTNIPSFLQYGKQIANNSLLNTAPTYPIYILMLVTRWLKKQGGLTQVAANNEAKAKRLYAAIDQSDFYRGTAAVESRSLMNVTFRLPTEELEAAFVKETTAKHMNGLKGHRSVGGIRASLYNAMPASGVDALIELMADFATRNK